MNTGVGLLATTNVSLTPVQPLAVGVTMIVESILAVVLLVSVNEVILSVPFAGRPVVVLLLVQLNSVPGTAPPKTTCVVAAPLHTD